MERLRPAQLQHAAAPWVAELSAGLLHAGAGPRSVSAVDAGEARLDLVGVPLQILQYIKVNYLFLFRNKAFVFIKSNYRVITRFNKKRFCLIRARGRPHSASDVLQACGL